MTGVSRRLRHLSQMTEDLIRPDAGGLYCPAGDFWIDPLRPVPRAVITHGHADHVRSGAGAYYTAREGLEVVAHRAGSKGAFHPVEYGQPFELGGARITFFPAGHILGSATVRVEAKGATWGVSGDFKRDPDPTCAPFEPFDCDVWLTECTFGLPVYRWPEPAEVAGQILEWWGECRRAGRSAVLFCYALGKAQRVMAELGRHIDEPVWIHGAMNPLTRVYREVGVELPETRLVSEAGRGHDFSGALVLAPPSAAGSSWMRRFAGHSAGFVSGWMQIRGNRRRRGYDRGFVLSDHADWPGLIDTVGDMNAGRVITIHGNGQALAAYLTGLGYQAESWDLRAGGEGHS